MKSIVAYTGAAHRCAYRHKSDIERELSWEDRVNLEGDCDGDFGFDLGFYSDYPVDSTLVCFEGGRPAGFLDLFKRPDRASLSMAIAVRPDCRNLGVATALVEKAREVSASRGFERIYYYSFRENAPSVRLAEKLGFVEYGWYLDDPEWFGGYIDLRIHELHI